MARNGKPCINRLKLAGKEFNDVKVIEFSHSNGNNTYWKCLCHCGKEYITIGSSIKNNTSKSCGCLRDKNFKRTPLKAGLASFNKLYNTYKYSSKNRGFIFKLSKQFFKKITKMNCFYCGAKPSQITKTKNKIKNEIYMYSGIDRVDNSMGYLEKNCVPCCKCCNRMKLAMNIDDFTNKISLIYERLVLSGDN